MTQYTENLLTGIKQWITQIIDDMSFVISSHINDLTSNKQDKLTAGRDISIENNTVSVAPDTFARLVRLTQAEYNALVQAGTIDDGTLYVITDAV